MVDKLHENMQYFEWVWESVSYVAMIDEWPPEKKDDDDEHLKDYQELRSNFMKNELDENAHEAFSDSVQMNYTSSKLAAACHQIMSRYLQEDAGRELPRPRFSR